MALKRTYSEYKSQSPNKIGYYSIFFQVQIFNHSKFLLSILFYNSRVIREALEIQNNFNNFNRKNGYRFSQSWKPVIHYIWPLII